MGKYVITLDVTTDLTPEELEKGIVEALRTNKYLLGYAEWIWKITPFEEYINAS